LMIPTVAFHLLKVLLSVSANLNDSARTNQARNNLPLLAMRLEALLKRFMFFLRPASHLSDPFQKKQIQEDTVKIYVRGKNTYKYL